MDELTVTSTKTTEFVNTNLAVLMHKMAAWIALNEEHIGIFHIGTFFNATINSWNGAITYEESKQ